MNIREIKTEMKFLKRENKKGLDTIFYSIRKTNFNLAIPFGLFLMMKHKRVGH